MYKFIAGVLVTMAFYNHALIMRTYYHLSYEAQAAERSARVALNNSPYREASPLPINSAVKEPTLDKLSSLGFQVDKQ